MWLHPLLLLHNSRLLSWKWMPYHEVNVNIHPRISVSRYTRLLQHDQRWPEPSKRRTDHPSQAHSRVVHWTNSVTHSRLHLCPPKTSLENTSINTQPTTGGLWPTVVRESVWCSLLCFLQPSALVLCTQYKRRTASDFITHNIIDEVWIVGLDRSRRCMCARDHWFVRYLRLVDTN